MSPQLPVLLHRVAGLKPKRIVLIKKDVYDAAYSWLADAGATGKHGMHPVPVVGAADGARRCVRPGARRRVTNDFADATEKLIADISGSSDWSTADRTG